ncbi:MAG: hypothetical protein KTR30_13450 [Saprospiraceae bacterium]|nr:hypothetical protein [Saprospiraceae bacterium]
MRPSTPTTYQRIITKLKLEDEFSIPVDMDKTAFLTLLKENIDEDTGPKFFESFNSKLKPYKGWVTPNGFKIKRTRRAFESNNEMARITGSVSSDFRQTVVTTHIGYPETTLKLIFWGLIASYGIILTIVLSGSLDHEPGLIPLIIVGHSLLIFGILYFILRYQVRTSTNKVRRFLENLLSKG